VVDQVAMQERISIAKRRMRERILRVRFRSRERYSAVRKRSYWIGSNVQLYRRMYAERERWMQDWLDYCDKELRLWSE
jgi:hypothetical protein